MSATLEEIHASPETHKPKLGGEPLRMKTWAELGEYLAAHLTPVRQGPKGQPVYAQKDLESLNIIWPDQD